MKIYIVVCYDRHVDEEITVHKTIDGAIKKCEEFMGRYPRYGLVKRPDWIDKAEEVPFGLKFVEDESGEYPRCHIETGTLKP